MTKINQKMNGIATQNDVKTGSESLLQANHVRCSGEVASNGNLADEGLVQKNVVRSDTNYPPRTFTNVLKTLAAYIAFLGGGMGNSILGATILHLEVQTRSTTKEIASVFLWRASGSLMGNALVALVFGMFPPEVILSLGCLGLVGANLGVPFCKSFLVLGIVIVFGGFSHGIIGAGCNSYVVKTWRLKSPPYLQALHFITSFGSCLTPLIVDLFVSHLADEATIIPLNSSVPTGVVNGNSSNETVYNLYQDLGGSDVTNESSRDGMSNVTAAANREMPVILFPYLIASVAMFTASLVFVVVFCIAVVTFRKQGLSRVDSFLQKETDHGGPVRSKPLLVTLLIISFIYGGMECTYGAWILSFVVKYLKRSFDTAALITTAYWGSLAIGRALSIPATKVVCPQYLIIVCFFVAFLGLLLMTLACTRSIVITWVCTVLIGLAFSPVFGNLISFSQQKLNSCTKKTTLFSLIQYIGFMSMPALVGFLFGNYTPMFFLYIPLVGAGSITLLFGGVTWFARSF